MYCLKAVQISDEPNEPRHEIPRDERGPPFVFVTPEPGNEYDRRENDPFPFTGEPTGPRDTTPVFDLPADCALFFLDEDLMQFICDNTNAKARIFFGPDLKRKVNGILWHDIDPQQRYVASKDILRPRVIYLSTIVYMILCDGIKGLY